MIVLMCYVRAPSFLQSKAKGVAVYVEKRIFRLSSRSSFDGGGTGASLGRMTAGLIGMGSGGR